MNAECKNKHSTIEQEEENILTVQEKDEKPKPEQVHLISPEVKMTRLKSLLTNSTVQRIH
jgi:hypothetical protein